MSMLVLCQLHEITMSKRTSSRWWKRTANWRPCWIPTSKNCLDGIQWIQKVESIRSEFPGTNGISGMNTWSLYNSTKVFLERIMIQWKIGSIWSFLERSVKEQSCRAKRNRYIHWSYMWQCAWWVHFLFVFWTNQKFPLTFQKTCDFHPQRKSQPGEQPSELQHVNPKLPTCRRDLNTNGKILQEIWSSVPKGAEIQGRSRGEWIKNYHLRCRPRCWCFKLNCFGGHQRICRNFDLK